MNGSVTIDLNDGTSQVSIQLNDHTEALIVDKAIWIKAFDFSKDAVLFVCASETYAESQYCDSYEKYLLIKEEKG